MSTTKAGPFAPRLAISTGDPAGIGPEVTAKAVSAFLSAHSHAQIDLFGDADLMRAHFATGALVDFEPRLHFHHHPLVAPAQPGVPVAANGNHVIALIAAAVAHVQAGDAQGLVTAPIAKSVLYEAGFAFPGHTEFLGHLAGDVPTHMMLASDELRVVPVTLHQSLASAIEDLSAARIFAATQAAHRALKTQFGIAQPRLAVCGLNPHAGESGTMGKEDEAIVRPAVSMLRDQGLDVTGPLPADTLFHAAARARYDCVVGMYHDQVLIPIKALAFDEAVNVTLGLPFVRASPDHGTAFDIAGKGLARPDSMLSALKLAAKLSAP